MTYYKRYKKLKRLRHKIAWYKRNLEAMQCVTNNFIKGHDLYVNSYNNIKFWFNREIEYYR